MFAALAAARRFSHLSAGLKFESSQASFEIVSDMEIFKVENPGSDIVEMKRIEVGSLRTYTLGQRKLGESGKSFESFDFD